MLPSSVQGDFAFRARHACGQPIAYFDNAAMMQMPEPVLQAVVEHERFRRANVHRGIHALSEESTERMEAARSVVRRFVGAMDSSEIVFTGGTTHSVNIVASWMARKMLFPGDRVVATVMEHHSNYCPWQRACEASGAEFVEAPMLDSGDLDLEALRSLVTPDTKMVAVTLASNVLGTVNPVAEVVRIAHDVGSLVLVDAAQGMRHLYGPTDVSEMGCDGPLDVSEIGCDFLAFSAHKIGGPEGVGVLYGERDILDDVEPFHLGGGMVSHVDSGNIVYDSLPHRLEAGTPNVAGAIGLAAAIGYMQSLGLADIARYEAELLAHIEDVLRSTEGVEVFGSPSWRAGCISFRMRRLSPYDVAVLLDKKGIAVRSGHHCAQPLMQRLGVQGTVRVSPAFFNTHDEVDVLAKAMAAISRIDSTL